MSEMVERIARKLCSMRGINPDALEPGDVYGIDGILANGDPAHFLWRGKAAQARQIIEEMREPTDAMNIAGRAVMPELDEALQEDAANCWQAMIDAALLHHREGSE